MRAAAILLLLAACDGPVRPLSSSGVRYEGAASAPAGSVARGAAVNRSALRTPIPAGSGSAGYISFCAPCHGALGAGDAPVIARGFTAPRSFAALSAEEAAPARTVAIITNGYGAMLSQAEQVLPAERWAIANHVAALARRSPGS